MGQGTKWAGVLAVAVAIGLVSWSVVLGATLPRTFLAQNWSLAWVELQLSAGALWVTFAVLNGPRGARGRGARRRA